MDYKTKAHFDAFKRDVEKECVKLTEKRPKHDKVSVLIIYWDRPFTDRPHIEEHAKALRAVFADGFGYETRELVLDDDNDSYRKLHNYFGQIHGSIGSKFEENNLFILYYGGHGTRDGMWLSREGDSPKTLDWQSAQKFLKGVHFDLLFLFDCCYAGSMIDSSITWGKACECLGASGRNKKAGGTKDASYTAAFTQLLREQLEKHGQIDIVRLGATTKDPKWYSTEKRKLGTSPYYECYSSGWPKISLVPLKDTISNDPSSTGSCNTPPGTVNYSDVIILIGISTSIPPNTKEFIEWLSGRPRGVSGIKVGVCNRELLQATGLWEGNLELAILSLLMWFWFTQPTTLAYQYTGSPTSDNFMAGSPDVVPQPVEMPQCSTTEYSQIPGRQKPEAFGGLVKANNGFSHINKGKPYRLLLEYKPQRTPFPWEQQTAREQQTPPEDVFPLPMAPSSGNDQAMIRIPASIPGELVYDQTVEQLSRRFVEAEPFPSTRGKKRPFADLL